MISMKAFNKSRILKTARLIIKNRRVCDSCLGRQFAQVSTGMTNQERGKILRRLLKTGKESGKCCICNNLFKSLDKYADEAVKKLKGMQFKTFLVGSKLSSDLIKREEDLWEDIGIEYCESIKSELNRELGKLIFEKLSNGKTKAEVDNKKPDMLIILNLENNPPFCLW
jgi:tRNA pseudouridine synthase 10